tara:strand:- start:11768 stop:12085 length:318 start_codon:yes stop_codon:yes gene_type:complete
MIITIKEKFQDNEELLEYIENLYITCPECNIIEDEQYQCTTCGSTNSKISFKDFLNTDISKDDYDLFLDEIYNMDNIILWYLENYGEEYEYNGIPISHLIEVKEV